MIIGITGNSGSGKTEFSKALLKKYSNKKTVETINADNVAKELSTYGTNYYKEIVELFGENILQENKEFNRPVLASIIFKDDKKREELNEITFKHVVQETRDRINKSKSEIILIDAPLLIESKLNNICDIVVSVIADKEKRIERICKRDNIDKQRAIERINAQPFDDFYIKNSNYVIINNNDINLEEESNCFLDILENSNNLLNNKEVVIIKNEDVKYIQFKKLLEFKNIQHAFTLRPLDFGDNKTLNEKRDLVDSNYNKIIKSLNIEDANLIRPYQTHTSNVKKLGDEEGIFPNELNDTDGLITNRKNKILVLSFADCTPIYLYDKEKQIIGNIHSGWQGTTKKIAKQAIIKMKEEFECNPKDIICIIGPTIRKCHFEVEEDVKDIFYNTFKYMNDIIEYNKDTKTYFIDTVNINKNLLKEEGILEKNIIDSNICTYCNSKFIHSFRKDKELSGRNNAIICIK